MCVICAVVFLGACTGQSKISSDKDFDAKLSSFLDGDEGSAKLSSMTSFEWDQFGYVGEGTEA